MNTKVLEYCIDIAQYRNFTRVAEMHYISQQALSQQIKNLEEELGVMLFERNRRSVKTTPAGEAFIQEAAEALTHIQSAVRNAQYYAQGFGGVISIGINGPTSQQNIMKIISRFARRYPIVDIRLKNGSYNEIVSSFQKENAYDLIVVGDFEELDSEEYEKRPCQTGTVVAVFGKDHPLAGRKEVTPRELLQEQLICLAGSSVRLTQRRMDWYRQILGEFPSHVKTAEDTDTVNMLVSGGLGYTLLNSSLKNEYNTESFSYVPIQGVEKKHYIWMVWRRTNENPVLPKFLAMAEDVILQSKK